MSHLCKVNYHTFLILSNLNGVLPKKFQADFCRKSRNPLFLIIILICGLIEGILEILSIEALFRAAVNKINGSLQSFFTVALLTIEVECIRADFSLGASCIFFFRNSIHKIRVVDCTCSLVKIKVECIRITLTHFGSTSLLMNTEKVVAAGILSETGTHIA